MYSGRIQIWNYETQAEVRSISVCEVPVRAGRFIGRKNWIVVGSDDFKIRVFNYNTGEKIADFEAHPDYIRSLAVHPTRPFVLSTSDDLTIKLWNWEQNWNCEQTFEGHEHFVMCVAFNPKDPNTFASACLDHTVKVWALGQDSPNFTLKAHVEKGVNYVDYYPLQDKPYLVTASDDRTVKVWDYQTKSCIATLEGHMANVSFAIFHPSFPIIVSGSEDGTVRIWNSNTYKLEKTLNLGLERSWCIAAHPTGKRNYIASGFDDGFTVLSLGNDEPKLSLDPVGKIVWCGGKSASVNEVFTSVIRGNEQTEDGEALSLQIKELGSVDVFPQTLKHSPNGRFVTVVGDGEFIVYTSLAWRNKVFGNCQDFVWGPDSNSYALIDETGYVKYYKNFKEVSGWSIPLNYGIEKLFTGALLGVKADGFIHFFDWESGILVRRIDVNIRDVVWSENGELVMLINTESEGNEESAAYALEFNKNVVDEIISNNIIDGEESIDGAFDVLYEMNEQVTSGKWVGDVFIFTTNTKRLNYFVGGKSYNLAHFDRDMYLLGYLARDNKVYLADKNIHIYGYEIAIEVLEFQTLVLRGELAEAKQSILPNIEGTENLLKISRFLEAQEYLEDALEISPDMDQKFDLSLKLGKLSIAYDLIVQGDNEKSWRTLGDAALSKFNFKLAIEAYKRAHDLNSLFLLYSSFNNKDELISLAKEAEEANQNNLAFNAYWTAGDSQGAQKLLISAGRYTEAALLGLTYGENRDDINGIINQWKEQLVLDGKSSIADRICMMGDADFPTLHNTLIDLDEPVRDETIINATEMKDINSTSGVTVPSEDEEVHSASEESPSVE